MARGYWSVFRGRATRVTSALVYARAVAALFALTLGLSGGVALAHSLQGEVTVLGFVAGAPFAVVLAGAVLTLGCLVIASGAINLVDRLFRRPLAVITRTATQQRVVQSVALVLFLIGTQFQILSS
jgi:hypothetical protein